MSDKIFRQPSVMTPQQHFSQVPNAEVQRSRFDRSHAYKTTFDAGRLIPVFVDEVMPGDTHTMNVTSFARLATPLHPIMDNLYMDTHFWFVPMRLVWENWVNFMGERDEPEDDPNDFSIPQMAVTLGDIEPASMLGYFGLPYRNGVTTPIEVSALYTRAMALIWNEWYRDQNLQSRVPFSKGAGPDDVSALHLNGSCYPRGKRKDYFTGALPWPQKGDPVLVPLGDDAPISGFGSLDLSAVKMQNVELFLGSSWSDTGVLSQPGSSTDIVNTFNNSFPNPVNARLTGSGTAAVAPGTMVADLSAATAVSINDLRTAFQIQRLLERDARGGTRYIELIWSHFRVQSDDARLQRPEYLGGGSQAVNVNPVAATVAQEGTPQGNLAAIGTVLARASFQKSFTEHGIIIGVVSVRADLTYQQGIERFWTKKTRYEFAWPTFAHLGEQAILNREIYAQGTAADLEVFGYQERYAEYRYKPSRITGLFASEQPSSLDVWHLSQDFASLPALNASFIEENPPIDRVIAVQTEPHFIADFWFDYKSDRPLPVYSVPGMIDHF